MTELDRINQTIEDESGPLHAALSDLGRRALYPPDIPVQAAQARGKRYNATIGQITDGAGTAIALPAIESVLQLADEDLNRALLYSPVEGLRDVRELWRTRQRSGPDRAGPSSLPLVTAGLTHGVSIVADLFAGEATPVAVPAPFWGNYRQAFGLRRGARIVTAPAYRDGAYNPLALEEALADSPEGVPAVAIVNIPSNPGGYSPNPDERLRLRESLVSIADRRPLVVVCDDAYAGLVYQDGIPSRSPFWELIGLHQNLIPFKVDGATKELNFFGGRVGFLTLPFPPESPLTAALESKIKGLVRATVGSPVAATQMVVLQALRNGDLEGQVAAVRETLGRRYRGLKSALSGVDRDLLDPLPFNSGCFALAEIPERHGLDSNDVRRHLLQNHDTGIVSLRPNYLRLAFCSVKERDIPELVSRVQNGLAELVGRS